MAVDGKKCRQRSGSGHRNADRRMIWLLSHPEKYSHRPLLGDFSERLPDDVLDNITLQTATGPHFKFVGRKNNMGNLGFTLGWKEFTDFYEINSLYFLQLKYKGNLRFNVQIHNETSREIKYMKFESGKKSAVCLARASFGGWISEEETNDVTASRKRKAADDLCESRRINHRASSLVKMEPCTRTTSASKPKDAQLKKEKTKMSSKEKDSQPYGQFMLQLPEKSLDSVCSLYIPRRLPLFTSKCEARPWNVYHKGSCCRVGIRLHKTEAGRADFYRGVRSFLKSNDFQSGDWLKFEVNDDEQAVMVVDVVPPPR